jgi:hypothetical protein
MKTRMTTRHPWALAIQIFRGGDWKLLRDERYASYRSALRAAKAHIKWANRNQLDPRNLAAFSFTNGKFHRVPWK